MAASRIGHWIGAFRLRTLPLAFSSILMGNFLAHWRGSFSWAILGLSLLTTLFLQVLSNLANDYGDSVHGADHANRQGPKRAVQSGQITKGHMKIGIVVLVILSLLSGISLLITAFPNQYLYIGLFLLLGLSAIVAAIKYTAGSNPYGYMGLGDVFVLLFFGLVAVCGVYFLQTKVFDWLISLPALACGLLATAVLNVNNVRDIESDRLAGKLSIPVRIGYFAAVKYHFYLVFGAIFAAAAFVVISNEPTSWLFLASVPLLVMNVLKLSRRTTAAEIDPLLKQLALSTLLFVVLLGIGLILKRLV